VVLRAVRFSDDVGNLVVTIAWVVAVVNAFNLMDNMDGAAGAVGAVSAAGAGVLGLIDDHVVLAALAFSVSGASLGFLRDNLSAPAARIFLGDGGSLPLGLLIAAVVMAMPPPSRIGWPMLLVGGLLVAVPALDTSLVTISRHRRGLPVWRGGRDHLTHRLRTRLPSARAVALVLGVAQAACCALAIGVEQSGHTAIFLAAGACVVAAACSIVLLERGSWAPAQGPLGRTRDDPAPPA
jgi:UDP-GlcNAc:undecaprenyl-phosphate GlcNAc-1-phosphate transferase